jgi:hypothetical protein
MTCRPPLGATATSATDAGELLGQLGLAVLDLGE